MSASTNSKLITSKIVFDQKLFNEIVKFSLLRKADVKGISHRACSIIKERKGFSEKFSVHETLQVLKLIASQPKTVRDYDIIKQLIKENLVA